jgi:hypothetical protein
VVSARAAVDVTFVNDARDLGWVAATRRRRSVVSDLNREGANSRAARSEA